ncbi:MAG: NADH-quinone oxidoreductase subunit J family protein [Candidatus Kariarchaeaceae archaeon]|jgi:NADH:ubiquinone oxidoreductase subunit 6 (subunit J)
MAYLFPPELFEAFNYLVLLILAIYTLGSAYLATSVKSVYHAVLWLIFSLLGVGLIFLLYAESAFLLVVQIIVYAGGITVLMLFAISLSGKEAMFEKPKDWKLLDWRLSFAGGFILFAIIVYILSKVSSTFWQLQDLTGRLETIGTEFDEGFLIEKLARELFTVHGGTVIVLGLLLLATMLGSVYLVKKEVEDL